MSTLSPTIYDQVDARTLQILERRRGAANRRRGWLVRRALLSADLFGLIAAFLISQRVFGLATASTGTIDTVQEYVLFAVSLPAWIVAAKCYGLYDKDEERTDHSTVDDFSRVFHLVTVGSWLLYGGAYLTGLISPNFPKLILFWALAVTAIPLARVAGRSYCRRQLEYLQNTIIVGAGDVGQMLAKKLLKHPEYGVNLVGFVDGEPREFAPGLDHLALLGVPDDIEDIIRVLDIERVIIAFSTNTHDQTLDLIRALNELDVQVDIVPRLFEVLSPAIDFHSVEGMPIMGMPSIRLSRSSRILKRSVDVLGAGIGLLLLSPLFAAVALWIKWDSPGPVFFRQVRMGTNDEVFRIFKFRTMAVDADARKHEFAHLNKHLGEDPRMFKIDDDPRVTRSGRWLRHFSIDELPQLINVVLGDMSLVGPRPLILEEHRYVDDWAVRRLDLLPGITGLWQVLGRDEIGFDEMVKLDYVYVTSWSLFGDIRLIFRTIPALLRGAA
jgi:exopolysaccharide biosynthesis polyprenyl glycosylphosphotransferase